MRYASQRYIFALCAVGVTACQYIFLVAFRFVRISRIISAASGPAPVSQSVGITVSRYPCMSGRYYRASIIGRRRFYPSELRPSIIRKGRMWREMEEGRMKKKMIVKRDR